MHSDEEGAEVGLSSKLLDEIKAFRRLYLVHSIVRARDIAASGAVNYFF
jgi:hypothetical protein